MLQRADNDVAALLRDLGERSRKASASVAMASADMKSEALRHAADCLAAASDSLCAANEKDMAFGRSKDLTLAQLDRLYLDDERIESMVAAVRAVAALADPVGEVLRRWHGDNGLIFEKIAVPIGVIGVIYESRPNVTADAAALCFKAGNSVILRCGSESFHSATVIAEALRRGIEAVGLSADAVQLIPSRDRDAVGALLASEHVDVIVPRGGKNLIARVQAEARMPVFAHLDGLCHTYIDKEANARQAKAVTLNAKLRRTGICGATETLLIHEDFSPKAAADILTALIGEGCEVRGCAATQKLHSAIKPATEEDWATEYLDKILSVRIVADLEEAIAHINGYGSHHTDAIITENNHAAEQFLQRIDSAIVLHNASTQFADGGEFGMGAEIGISTGRLHARGPVGVNELTIYKYRVHGNGQCRS